jgi:hypothetical protein
MAGAIYSYLADDHRRLEDALQRATNSGGVIEPQAYAEFRGGLLRHIGMEEKILLPEARAAQGGKAIPLAPRLRLDHGALAALLVLTPTHSIIAAIRTILAAHNPLEEGADGVYEQCERLAGTAAERVLVRLQNTPAVSMAAHVDNPVAMESTRQALQRAGYDLKF